MPWIALLVSLFLARVAWAHPPIVVVLDAAKQTRVRACNVCVVTLTETTTFRNPEGTPQNKKLMTLEIHSSTPVALAWETKYMAQFGYTLPTMTSGTGKDALLWQYDQGSDTWELLGLSPSLAPAPAP